MKAKNKNFRKRSFDEVEEKPRTNNDSDEEQERRLALEEIKFLQKQREKKSGIPAILATNQGAAGGGAGPANGGGGSGCLVSKVSDKNEVDGEKDELVLQDTFAQETAVMVEDPNMLRYVEQELAKRRGKNIDVANQVENEIKHAEDELYKIPEHLKNSKYRTEFREHNFIGEGSDGAIFTCTNKFDHGKYVVKKISFTENNEERVKREAIALAELQHRYVIQYFQSWEEVNAVVEEGSKQSPTKTLFILLERCESTLEEKLLEGTIDKIKAVDCCFQLLNGVEYIHSTGWIHRDLSSENILFDKFDELKIGDFSTVIEKNLSEQQVDFLEEVGKPFYAAPEVSSWDVTPAADIYSLGVLLFELMHLFEDDLNRTHALDKLVRKIFPPGWKGGKRLAQLIMDMMDVDPSRRPSIGKVIERFKECVSDEDFNPYDVKEVEGDVKEDVKDVEGDAKDAEDQFDMAEVSW